MTPDRTRKAALTFARRGWSVFPLRENGRTPAFGGSFYDATTDPDLIRAWFADRPNLNLGMSTHESGPFVVDLDVKHGKDGVAAWKRLTAGHQIPDTMTVRTPSGGQHLYFVCSEGDRPRSTVNKPARGIDIRGRRAYVVAPTSRTDLGTYRVVQSAEPAHAPSWLIEAVRATGSPGPPSLTPRERRVWDSERYRTSIFERLLRQLRSATEGERNDTLNLVAFRMGQFAGAAISSDALIERIATEGIALGLEPGESWATARSGVTDGMADPIVLLSSNGSP